MAGPDLLPGFPAMPAPLFVLDCANAIDEASIAAITIRNCSAHWASSTFSGLAAALQRRVSVGNEDGLLSFLWSGRSGFRP